MKSNASVASPVSAVLMEIMSLPFHVRLYPCTPYVWALGLVIWQSLDIRINVVRLRVFCEPNGGNRGSVLQQRLAHPVHSIHYAPGRRKDDRKCQVGFLDQLGVEGDGTTRSGFAVEPEALVEFG